MYMTVILHILGHGGVLNNLEILSLKYNIAWLLEIICYCAVNCYALITGYVMVNSKFKYKKMITLYITVLFWSLLLTTIINLIYPYQVGKRDFLKAICNITFNTYWYFSSYFALFFFIPFINKLIETLDKINYKRLIITIIVLMSLINLINEPFKMNSGYSFIWLIFLYFIGAYIKKYNIGEKISKIKVLIGILISILLTITTKLVFTKYPNLTLNIITSDTLVKYISFTILFIAIGLLLIFSNLRINNKYLKRFIKRLAPATFGVYLIHEQPVIRKVFITNTFKFITTYEWYKIILIVLSSAFIIYMFCSYLEMIRIFIFKKLKIQTLENIIFEKIKKISKKIKLYEEVKE